MIKGCSRRMIVLKDTGSDLFEEAYFVLRSGAKTCSVSGEKDFIAEARRIIAGSQSGTSDCTKKPSKSRKAVFAGGFISGAVFGFLVFCLPALI